MASSKRRPDKQKRSRQNRQVRQARSARSANAGAATSVRRGDGEATQESGDGGRTTASSSGAGGTGSARKGRTQFAIPGQRAIVMAFLFSLVSAGMLFVASFPFEKEVPPDSPLAQEEYGDEVPEPDDDGNVTVTVDERPVDEIGFAATTAYAAIPVLITGAAVAFTKRRQRSTAWTMAMIALAGYVFFAGGIATYALAPMIALAVGGFQSRRAENKERIAQLKAERAGRSGDAGDGPTGEVIDVDSVEDEAPDDAPDDATGDEDGDAPRR